MTSTSTRDPRYEADSQLPEVDSDELLAARITRLSAWTNISKLPQLDSRIPKLAEEVTRRSEQLRQGRRY